MSLINKVVCVTGASSGIGADAAVAFTREGADVVLVARNQAKLDKVKADCEEAGKKPLVVIADLVKTDDVKRLIATLINKYGKLDVLVNNAGFGKKVLLENKDFLKVFDDIIALNLRAVVNLTHTAAPYLIKTKGNIVNISSVAALNAGQTLGIYCTAKASLDHFSRCIANELAPKGVRVNTVNPGPVRTNFFENMGLQDVNQFYTNISTMMPLKRVSEPEEISNVILFLASDKAKGVTGSSWVTDDGFMISFKCDGTVYVLAVSFEKDVTYFPTSGCRTSISGGNKHEHPREAGASEAWFVEVGRDRSNGHNMPYHYIIDC